MRMHHIIIETTSTCIDNTKTVLEAITGRWQYYWRTGLGVHNEFIPTIFIQVLASKVRPPLHAVFVK